MSLDEIKQFPTVERRRNAGVPGERREAGEVAVFQELGKALTSSLQLDQVLRTIMEKLLDEISFEGPDLKKKTVRIDAVYVENQLVEIVKNQDLSRYIL